MANRVIHILVFLLTVLQLNNATPQQQQRSSATNGGSPAPENSVKFLSNYTFNNFDWELSKTLGKLEPSNFVLSPISIKLALAMLHPGLQGIAAKQIETAFSVSKEPLSQKFASVIKSFQVKGDDYELNVGTKVYVDSSTSIQREYDATLRNSFNASIQTVDFRNTGRAIAEINAWCKEVTKGRISQLLGDDDVNDSTAMMLLNAIYFKGEWEKPFSQKDTHTAPFWVSRTKSVYVQRMLVRNTFYHSYIPQFNADLFRLPYAGKKFAMYIIYPKSLEGLNSIIENINPGTLSTALKQLKEYDMEIRMPKFKFDSKAVLVPILKQLGITELFSDKVNLNGIGESSRGPLSISSVLQKSGIEVNEQGSSAYASTDVSIVSRFGSDAVEVTIEHPFAFLIADESSDTIVFTGKVLDPSVSAGSPSNAPTENPEYINERIKPSQEEYEIKEKYNFFDKELLEETVDSYPDRNIILSPVSLKSMLALVFEGARANTEKELIESMNLSSDKKSATEELGSQIKIVKDANSQVTIYSQNKVYLSDDEKLSAQYKNVINSKYGSDVQLVDFAKNVETANKINKWVNEVTKGAIPSLVSKDNFDSNTKLFLANGIYFKADWEIQFDPKYTIIGCFNTSSGCHLAYLMREEMTVSYSDLKDLDAKLVELPFVDQRYSLVLAIPNKVDGVNNLVRNLQHEKLLHLFSEMKPQHIKLSLPRTTIEFSSSYKNILKKLKIEDLFDASANLSGILDAKKPLYVNDVVHKAKIEINEKGSKAGAASGAQVMLLSAPSYVDVRADRPFAFFVRDKTKSGFLFEGVLVSPDKVDQKENDAVDKTGSIATRIAGPSVTTRRPVATTAKASKVVPVNHKGPVVAFQNPRPTEEGSAQTYRSQQKDYKQTQVPVSNEIIGRAAPHYPYAGQQIPVQIIRGVY